MELPRADRVCARGRSRGSLSDGASTSGWRGAEERGMAPPSTASPPLCAGGEESGGGIQRLRDGGPLLSLRLSSRTTFEPSPSCSIHGRCASSSLRLACRIHDDGARARHNPSTAATAFPGPAPPKARGQSFYSMHCHHLYCASDATSHW
ncbi:unnamed protein product [Urochloa humidicola]